MKAEKSDVFAFLVAQRLEIMRDKVPAKLGLFATLKNENLEQFYMKLLWFLDKASCLASKLHRAAVVVKRNRLLCDVSFLCSHFSPGSCPESLPESHLHSLTGFQTKEDTFST